MNQFEENCLIREVFLMVVMSVLIPPLLCRAGYSLQTICCYEELIKGGTWNEQDPIDGENIFRVRDSKLMMNI